MAEDEFDLPIEPTPRQMYTVQILRIVCGVCRDAKERQILEESAKTLAKFVGRNYADSVAYAHLVLRVVRGEEDLRSFAEKHAKALGKELAEDEATMRAFLAMNKGERRG